MKTDIKLPPLPVAVPWHKGYDRESLESYARAAVEADRQGRMPSAAEISGVIREITGHSDIKIGHESLVVKLSFLFARYDQPAASMESVAYQHRIRAMPGGKWGDWTDGRAPHLLEDTYRVQERPVFVATAQHPDDAAVDAFAAAMKAKLAKKRVDGRTGWQECGAEYLSGLLREHVEKGDLLGVANLAMMLHQNGQRIEPAEPLKAPSDDAILSVAVASEVAYRDSTGAVLCFWREDTDISKFLIQNARILLARYGQWRKQQGEPTPEGFCLHEAHREHKHKTGEDCTCPKYVRHPSCVQHEVRKYLPSKNPWEVPSGLRNAVCDLVSTWRKQQSEYPAEGKLAAAAVRLCANELEDLLARYGQQVLAAPSAISMPTTKAETKCLNCEWEGERRELIDDD